MAYCKSCGEIVYGQKCTKCGSRYKVEDAVASTPTNEKRDRWSSTYLANGGLQRAATRTNSLAYSPSRSLVKSTDQSTPAKELITKPISEVIEPVSDLPLCYLCDDPIKQNEQRFLNETEVCLKCYLKEMSRGDCSSCHNPIIKTDFFIQHNLNLWHLACFRCHSCQKNLNSPMVDLSGRPCCEDCLMAQANKGGLYKAKSPAEEKKNTDFVCKKCDLKIRDTAVKLPNGDIFHQKCFTCAGCDKEFEQSAFVSVNGQAYHTECAPKKKYEKCGVCGKDIRGLYVKNHGVSFHNDCFTCSGCGKVISSDTPFGEIHKKPYCESCLRERCGLDDPFTENSISTTTSEKKNKPLPDPQAYKKSRQASHQSEASIGPDQEKAEPPLSTKPKNVAPPEESCPPKEEKPDSFKELPERKVTLNDANPLSPRRRLASEPYINPLSPRRPLSSSPSSSSRTPLVQRTASPVQSPPPPAPASIVSLSSRVPTTPPLEPKILTDGPVHPSQLLRSQSPSADERFSRLGGVNKCFKCGEKVYRPNEVAGPRATKWHKRCLVCVDCKKPLDSAALMRTDDDGPYCRLCFVKRGH